jgi:hypothetical protein
LAIGHGNFGNRLESHAIFYFRFEFFQIDQSPIKSTYQSLHFDNLLPELLIEICFQMEINKIIDWLKENRKTLIIICGIVVLNLVYGFDARFTLINLLWLLV